MKEKVLILGGTEFVGRQLVEVLSKDESKEVYLFNRGKTNPDLFPTVKRIIGDRETEDIQKIKAHQWDYVIDFSSYFPKSLQATLAQINQSVKKYIYISTISVYDFEGYDSSFAISEDFKKLECSAEEAVDPSMKTYGKKKAACETVLTSAEWLNAIILRPSIIYGKYDPTERFYYWLQRMKMLDKVLVPDQHDIHLSMTYAADLVAIILSCIHQEIPNGAYNCTTHEPITFRDMLKMMQRLLGSKVEWYEIERKILREEKVKFPLLFIGNLKFYNDKIKKASGLTFTSFETSLKNLITYYEAQEWPTCKITVDQQKENTIIENKKF